MLFRANRCHAKVALLLCGWIFGASQSGAQEPPRSTQSQDPQAQPAISVEEITAVPNRPTFSTTAESVQPGVFEIEYGVELADGHQNINGLLKFGLTSRLELRFANNPIERDFGVAGRGDSGAGFKYRFVDQKNKRPTIAVLYTAILPTATAEVGLGAVGHSAGILVSKDFGKHHFDFNETAQWLGRPGASGFDRNYFTALAYSHGMGGKWGFTAEAAGFSWTNAAAPATMTLMAGATYSVSSRLVLDTGAYVAAYGSLPRVTFFAGVTYSVADLYHRH
ncbi:MAG TPA: transporter [Candidatus Acidoferrum sp.]|nr:transporter [Candidatus Acidoferrum sp.]